MYCIVKNIKFFINAWYLDNVNAEKVAVAFIVRSTAFLSLGNETELAL